MLREACMSQWRALLGVIAERLAELPPRVLTPDTALALEHLQSQLLAAGAFSPEFDPDGPDGVRLREAAERWDAERKIGPRPPVAVGEVVGEVMQAIRPDAPPPPPAPRGTRVLQILAGAVSVHDGVEAMRREGILGDQLDELEARRLLRRAIAARRERVQTSAQGGSEG
jgi:hypothetical protein